MDNTENPTTRQLSVTFERKKDLGNYNNSVVRTWLSDDVPADMNDGDVSQKLVELLNVCKAATFDALGIESFMDDTGVIREKHEPVASVKQAADNVGTQFAGTTAIRIMNQDKLDADFPGIPADIVEACVRNDIAAVWANNGQYGWFFKEAVKQGEQPKIPDSRDPSKAGIIKHDS